MGFDTYTNENGYKVVTTSYDAEANRWYHIAGVYNGVEIKLYINGVLENTVPQNGNITTGNNPLWINKYPCPNGSDWAHFGRIDEVRIYNEILSDEEILALYNEQE